MKTCMNNSIRIWRQTPVALAIGYGGRDQEGSFGATLSMSETGDHPDTAMGGAEAASR
jgi:hypothetical protein